MAKPETRKRVSKSVELPQVPFDDALRRILSAAPKHKKAPKKRMKKEP